MGLYAFQKKVKELVMAGQSVILQAPTGAGKTRGALAPFIEGFFDGEADQFPRKCIYSVPMRVLANQFVEEYGKLAEGYGRKFREELRVSIQTGARPDDPKVESGLLFTTVDQTLSNFLNIPYGLGKRSANLNAGAVVGSYLVFDELHLYDPNTMLPTTLEMLRMLGEVTPFVIMTATFSSSMLARLGELLGAVVVPGDEAEREAMESLGTQVGKVRRFHALDVPLTAEAVLESDYEGQRVICICNTVAAAQRLYVDLRESLAERGDEETVLCLLHSRFYRGDRDEKEKWVREQFGIGQAVYDGVRLILVATQVIEVGLDVTCDVMHTEVAPAASLLQRAGRCARKAGERGEVCVYLPRDEEGNPNFVPYFLPSQHRHTERGLRLCTKTWEALLSGEFTGRHMSFQLEQALIDRVHTPIDQEILDEVEQLRHSRREDMLYTMQTQELGMAPQLIRNISNRFVVIHPNPDEDEKLARNPWHYEGFALYPGSLAKGFGELQAEASEAPWLMQGVKGQEGEEMAFDEESPSRIPTTYEWYPLGDSQEVFESPVVALHPMVAHYDKMVGLLLQLSDEEYVLHARSKGKAREAYAYERETYAEHVSGLYGAYRRRNWKEGWLPLADEMAYVMRRLEGNPGYRLERGMIDRVLRACFACHDLGKLNVEWQSWAHRWQKRVGQFYGGQDMSLPKDYMAAHTDFEPTDEQRKAQYKLGKRPPHAGESAMASEELLDVLCGENEGLYRAAVTAIARHHSPRTERYRAFVPHEAAERALAEAFEVVGLPKTLMDKVWWEPDGEEPLASCLVSFDLQGVQGVLLYLVLVRVLRLADQRSQV